MATAADWMSAASFISMASFPLMAMMVPFIWWVGLVDMFCLPFTPYLRKFGKFTVPDFVENVITLTPQERLPLSVH
jgi:cation/acetate symporter